ncbi:MAG: nucleotide exchange factor GrpE [Desulfamplus sp.]|nr:nucleotide exchange factor GrpE [Desulfamplus sp.]
MEEGGGGGKKDAQPCKKESDAGTKGDNSAEVASTMAELIAALDAEKDRVIRLAAEFDNYKKRSAREMAEFRKYANETIIKQLLTVVDNLERAIASANSDKRADKASIVEGVEMTLRDILKLFDSFSVKRVDALGKPFDPSFHQAVSHQESDEHPDNTVINELQKGYTLHDRLIRPSMVVVSKAA